MSKKTQNQKTLFYGIGIIAVIAVIGVAFFAFSGSNQPFKTNLTEGKLHISWNMGEAPTSAVAQPPLSTEITAYQGSDSFNYYSPSRYLEYSPSSGFGLVKEVREVDLAEGLVALSLKSQSAHIDATSVSLQDLTDGNTQIVEQNYDYDLASQEKLVQKYLGEQITVKTDNETITGTLLSADSGLLLQTANGVVALSNYKQIVFPQLPQGLLTTPTLNLLLGVQKAGKHTLQVSYLTSGINWEANYVAIASADDSKVDLQALVSVTNNAGATFKDAKLKLVAGNVNKQSTSSYKTYASEASVGAAPMADNSRQFTQQSLSEYHLYSLDRQVTLANGQQKQITFFEAKGVKAQKELVFQPSYQSKVQVKLNIENSNDSGLGLPMPAGNIRVFKPDSTGQLQFIGEDSIDHTPEQSKLRLYLGDAFDVTGERTQTSENRMGDCAEQLGYSVALKNAKAEDVTVTVIHDEYYGEVRIVEESQPSTKEDAHKFSWKVPIKAKSSATLTYKVYREWC